MDKNLKDRISDYLDKAYSKETVRSNFLNLAQIEEVEKMLGKKINYRFDGGYEQASRKRVIFNTENSQIVMLEAKFDPKFNNISHPDVLGALMASNLNRDRMGDLLVLEDKIIVFVVDEIKKVIIEQVTEIKNSKIKFREVNYQVEPLNNLLACTSSVSTLRLDAIVASLASTSREKAKMMIKNKVVSINHQVNDNHKKEVKDGNIISIRKVGRFRFNGVIKESKKARLIISYAKYQ